MAFNRQEGGHAFDFDRGVCARCGITRERYEDSGKPKCTGKRAAAFEHKPGHGHVPIVDDEK